MFAVLLYDCVVTVVIQYYQYHHNPQHMFDLFKFNMCMKEIFDHLPKQRKLGQEQKREACSLLKMKVNKKLLQQHLSSNDSDSDLDALVTRLRASEGTKLCSYMHSIIRIMYICS